jgi:hypothetical protein
MQREEMLGYAAFEEEDLVLPITRRAEHASQLRDLLAGETAEE